MLETNLAGKQAVLITGTSSGIGRGCALYLDKMGYRVFAGVRNDDDATAIKKEASPLLTPVCLDVTSPSSIASAKQCIMEKVGDTGLYALINNAGISSNGPLEYYPLEQVRQMFEVNLFGLLAVTQAFLPLIKLGHGRIINISSVSAMMAFPFSAPYCASKYAVEIFSECLGMELSSVPVSVIEPANIASAIWDKSGQTNRQILESFPPEAQAIYGAAITKLNEANSQQVNKTDSPERIAKLVVKILTVKKPGALYREGRMVNLLRLLRILPRGLRHKMILSQLK
ncbi:MAG: SDR family oxidoreductase [Chloroflexi bacterium]|uniref:SDR family oxidoreductase n=1 Tax=Candidatus Chlorohelix allophototropha TaxID=3003348 RepID=A0A8T7M2F2_9CHLR|nr:SDR family oxidoreductase [Chloroflexota bacterium]WJW65558.1 SDR family oxidoreductase [Chloroflexota bacterium L227-S17]